MEQHSNTEYSQTQAENKESQTETVEIEVIPVEQSKHRNPYLLLLLSGLLSTIGSTCSKLATTSFTNMINFFSSNFNITISPESYIIYAIKVISFIISLSLGAISMTIYVNAMTIMGSLSATVVSSGLNFVFSGLFGWILFDETLTMKWLLGSVCVLMGLILIVFDSK